MRQDTGAALGLPQQIGRLGYIGQRQDAHVLTIQAGPRKDLLFPPLPERWARYSCCQSIDHAVSLLVCLLLNVSFWFCVTEAHFLLPLPLAPYNTR